jgi:hypothetical protein
MAEQQQATKKRKLDQVSNQQQLELDIDCNGGCYYIVTTNEDQSLNDIHQFLLPENIYNNYTAFISNFNPKIDISDYEPFSNKEILSFKDLEAIKDFFKHRRGGYLHLLFPRKSVRSSISRRRFKAL